MKTNVIVVDDFYTNAEKTREFILQQEFTVRGNYPGFRTKSYATEDIKQYFEDIIGKKISWFQIKDDTYNGCFQYTTKDMDSWVHRDVTDWAGVIYLTPDAPPDAGTAFFRHKETGLEMVTKDTSKEDEEKMDNDSNDMSKWEMIDFVGNKFNRLILFRGDRSHRSMTYFGDNKYNGRLFQLFFFNEEGSERTKKMLCNGEDNTQHVERPLAIQSDKKTKITVIFFTTSRYEYLIPMMESFHQNVDFGNYEVYKILMDDYPLRRNMEVLDGLVNKYKINQLVLNPENLGYSVAWKKMWNLVPDDTDYIWHQEDDFVFKKNVLVSNLVDVLETSPVPLNQVVLKRQKWFESNDFIDHIETGKVGEPLSFDGKNVVIHQHYFNSNPGLYPRWILDEDYEFNPQESVISDHLRRLYPDRYSAILGEALDEPYITHIGGYNQGKKVLEGEPGWSWLKDYNPDKQYNSKGYLKEWEK